MAATTRHTHHPPFHLVVAVASLGGLSVLSALADALPPTFPVPVLVLQHGIRSTSPNRLAYILAQRATVPVRTAWPGMPAHAPGITVIPGGHAAVIDSTGHLRLAEATSTAGDGLLTTAAATAPGPVIGVILSGMLHDGTQGIRAIKRHGGRAIAQDPATARAPSMPSSAIATGCVDFVLPPHRIPPALIALTMAPGAAELFTIPLPHWAKTTA